MEKKTVLEKISHFLFENKVMLLFLAVTIGAFFASGLSTAVFFEQLFTRFGRNTFMVLALLIPIVAGIGLNFGIVLGAMAAQISIFLVVLWGGTGGLGMASIFLLSIPIAVVFGYLVGSLFNRMKGSEMVGGLITGMFAEGFYQFFFLFFLGGIIPIAAAHLMTPTGVGVINVIEMDRFDMRHILELVPIIRILDFAFWGTVVGVVGMVLIRLVKKQPVALKGPSGMLKPLIILGALAVAYLLAFIPPVHAYLSQDRLSGVTAVDVTILVVALYQLYVIIRAKLIDKKPGIPVKPLVYLGILLVAYLITWTPPINTGLEAVGIPVFSYLLIVALCLFIGWFMNTRLGQNMRTVGQNRAVATAAGINVDRTRIIAMIISTVLAAFGQIIILQSLGMVMIYGAHLQVSLYAVASLLLGGATVSKASPKNAIMGVLLFHALFILAPVAGNNLLGSANIGEYFRVFVTYAVVALALVMHAWKRAKKK